MCLSYGIIGGAVLVMSRVLRMVVEILIWQGHVMCLLELLCEGALIIIPSA